MRDHIKVVLHVLQTERDLLNVIHLCELDLILDRLLHHEVEVFLLFVETSEADVEGLLIAEEIDLEVAIGLTLLCMNVRARGRVKSPNFQLDIVSLLPANIVVEFEGLHR